MGFIIYPCKSSIHVISIQLYLLLLLFSGNVYASPWMQSEGDSVGSTGISYSQADSFWKRDGKLMQYTDKHQEATYYLYGEYGYSYYYNLIASTGWNYRDDGIRTNNSIDDIKIGIRGRLNRFRNGRTWQVNAILPTRRGNLLGSRPDGGKAGIDAGIYYRIEPDPYLNPFTVHNKGIWGGGFGITLRSGGIGSELWAYGKWEKNVITPSWQAGFRLSALSSFAGAESGSVDIYGPNDSYHYHQINSEFLLKYQLNRTTTINTSYVMDLDGSNINRNSGVHIGISTNWKK
ncbi:MAG: hypothetical protein HZA08_10335 [Nitrospirae bacterium]|nr:hypothetical protein [Nitrospirota bacterium]